MSVQVITGDCRAILATLPDESVHCCVTSPPYFGLRDYGVAGQIGLEASLDDYIAEMVAVFREVRRVMRSDGTLWLNLGDSYAANRTYQVADTKHRDVGNSVGMTVPTGLKPKDLMMVPARAALALQADGWWLRKDIIWHKPNPMPESCQDRPTSSHEHVFLLAKSATYFYDADSIREAESVPGWDDGSRTFGGVNAHGKNAQQQRTTGRVGTQSKSIGRNKRDVWTISTTPFPDAHFATFPPALVEPCIKAGCPVGGTVLDPFGGAGTTGLVADRLLRNAVLIELNPAYAEMAKNRITADAPLFGSLA
jgi:DNA modification methylase